MRVPTSVYWRGLVLSLLVGLSLQAAIPTLDSTSDLEARAGGPYVGAHCALWTFTIPPPRLNAISRRDISDTVNNNGRQRDITFTGVDITVNVQATRSPFGHNINMDWTNNLFQRMTVLVLSFRPDQDPLRDPPVGRIEYELEAAEPGPWSNSPSTRRICTNVADGWKWALQIRGPA